MRQQVSHQYKKIGIIITGYKIEKNEMGGSCSAYGGGERRVHGFDGETWGKRPLGRPRIFRKWDLGVWTELSWLRIGTGGWHL
jgi:hypothetical protein